MNMMLSLNAFSGYDTRLVMSFAPPNWGKGLGLDRGDELPVELLADGAPYDLLCENLLTRLEQWEIAQVLVHAQELKELVEHIRVR
jgi:hypothetical protein